MAGTGKCVIDFCYLVVPSWWEEANSVSSEVVKTALLGFLPSPQQLRQTGKMCWLLYPAGFRTRWAERVGLVLLQQRCSALCVSSAPVNVQPALGIAGLAEEWVKAAC